MRAFVILIAVGCGSSNNPADVPADHRLYDLGSDTATIRYIRYGGKQVPLADIPLIAETVGLPVSGAADVVIDVAIPKPHGKPDYTKATGSIELACTKCQLGDDTTKLRLGDELMAALEIDGIAFGHLTIDHLEVTATIAQGKLALTTWKLRSPDLELEASLAVDFAHPLRASEVRGCVRFRPTDALRKRDPRLHDLLSLTGASQAADGMYNVTLEGEGGGLRRLAKECSAK